MAHQLPITIDRALRTGFFKVRDPGSAGTIGYSNKGYAICEVVTAGAETRTLPTVSGYPVGHKLTVIFKTDGGDLTISGSDQTVVLANAGEVVEFVVVDNNGTKAWRVAYDSRVAFSNLGATLPADTATTTEISALGTAYSEAEVQTLVDAFLELTAALTAAGVIDTDFTQATA